MSAYKDSKKGTWYVKFRYKDWRKEAKWITKRGFQTKREALAWEKDFLSANDGNTDMSFSDFVKVYLKDCEPRLKESTLATKTNIIEKKLLPFFGNLRLRDITATTILQWQNELLRFRDPHSGSPYSKVYLKTVHNQLSAIFNHAVRYYGLKENPARMAGNMGSEKGTEMKFWTQEEYQKFSEAMMDYPVAFYCFEMLYWCGIREGEMLALTPKDFDFEKGVVSITKTFQHINGRDIITEPKTPKSRRCVVMPSFLQEEIQTYIRMCYDLNDEDRLFPVTKTYLYKKMAQGCQAQGLPRIRVHDLRYSHVSLLIHMGFSAVAIADRMGHESIDITYRYAHLFPSVQDQMAEKLSQLRKE